MTQKRTKTGVLQVVRFGIVGAVNTLLDYGLFYLLISATNLHKSFAQVFATGVAMCFSFLANRHWTFGKSGRGSTREIVKFFVVNVVAMLTVIGLTHLFYDIWHVERLVNSALYAMGGTYAFHGDGAIMLAKLISSVFSVVINFLGNKLWVFSDASQENDIM